MQQPESAVPAPEPVSGLLSHCLVSDGERLRLMRVAPLVPQLIVFDGCISEGERRA
jgi:hypothetical protein